MPSNNPSFYDRMFQQEIEAIPRVIDPDEERRFRLIQELFQIDEARVEQGLEPQNEVRIQELEREQREFIEQLELERLLLIRQLLRNLNANNEMGRERDERERLEEHERSFFLVQICFYLLVTIVSSVRVLMTNIKYLAAFIICDFTILLLTSISKTENIPQIAVYFIVNMLSFTIISIITFIDKRSNQQERNRLYILSILAHMGGLITIGMWYFNVSGWSDKIYNFFNKHLNPSYKMEL